MARSLQQRRTRGGRNEGTVGRGGGRGWGGECEWLVSRHTEERGAWTARLRHDAGCCCRSRDGDSAAGCSRSGSSGPGGRGAEHGWRNARKRGGGQRRGRDFAGAFGAWAQLALPLVCAFPDECWQLHCVPRIKIIISMGWNYKSYGNLLHPCGGAKNRAPPHRVRHGGSARRPSHPLRGFGVRFVLRLQSSFPFGAVLPPRSPAASSSRAARSAQTPQRAGSGGVWRAEAPERGEGRSIEGESIREPRVTGGSLSNELRLALQRCRTAAEDRT